MGTQGTPSTRPRRMAVLHHAMCPGYMQCMQSGPRKPEIGPFHKHGTRSEPPRLASDRQRSPSTLWHDRLRLARCCGACLLRTLGSCTVPVQAGSAQSGIGHKPPPQPMLHQHRCGTFRRRTLCTAAGSAHSGTRQQHSRCTRGLSWRLVQLSGSDLRRKSGCYGKCGRLFPLVP